MSSPRDPKRSEGTKMLTRERVKRPPLYMVLFHNDDYTSQEFVVMVLMRYFYKSHADATHVMLSVHTTGKGVGGIYPLDIASTKVKQVERLAQDYEMPLKLSIEPESGGKEDGAN